MEPRIEVFPEKRFVGKRLTMSLTVNKTLELWKSFMPRRKEIINAVGKELYSVEIYESSHFTNFNADKKFDKWAVVEVTDFDSVPHEMESFLSPTGLYAVFIHKGPASNGSETYHYIFDTWLPGSDFLVETRPHFAVMGEKYKGEDPDSEEELWIPVKLKV